MTYRGGGILLAALLLCLAPAWADPPTDNGDPYRADRERMVEEHIAGTTGFGKTPIKDPAVLSAMRTVPRHEFVPERLVKKAYADRPLPIGHGQTISQPSIVAAMTELLKLPKDAVVLEIGTGSGYHAAVLGQVAREVYTIEIVEPLAAAAKERLSKLGYANVHAKQGDGYFGWKEHGPYDAIVVTAAASHIPPPLVEQLKPGGRMVIPVGPPLQVQNLMLVEKSEDGNVTQRNIRTVQFAHLMRGPAEPGASEP